MNKKIEGFIIGFSIVLFLKYVVLGERQWNRMWADFHRRLPGNIQDEFGNP